MKLARGMSLVIASHNEGKVCEIRDMLAPYGLSIKSAAELGLEEPEETGSTFADNAALKARATRVASGMAALADDSGLVVTALDGAPGIYSARWAGSGKNFASAMTRVKNELSARKAADMSAKFVCALALAMPDGDVRVFEGEVCGHLEFPARGTNGFGYDPIFVPDGFTRTFGEMEPRQKHAMSHRARAFKKFIAATGLTNAGEP